MIKDIENRICGISLLIGGAASLIFFLLGSSQIGSGLAIGFTTSVLNFKLLGRTITKIARHNPRYLFATVFSHYLVRYFISGLILSICIQRSLAMFWAAAAGLFAVRIAIYLYVWHVEERLLENI